MNADETNSTHLGILLIRVHRRSSAANRIETSWKQLQEAQKCGALLRLNLAVAVRIEVRDCHTQTLAPRWRHCDGLDSIREEPVNDANRLRTVKRGGVLQPRQRH